jgi:hypothetical protein
MYRLENVTANTLAWTGQDPVRPELTDEFRIASGREVYGLRDESGRYNAFVCIAYTSEVPTNTDDLETLTCSGSTVVVPYSVWSHQPGAGREIIKQVSSLLRNRGVERVVTLSPPTKMARRFHLRNGAIELRVNETTVNFEYPAEAGSTTLTDEQLENVVGGMNPQKFDDWRARELNENR